MRCQKPDPGRPKPFEELLRGVPDAEITGDARVEVRGLAYDSRKVVPGGLFVAVKGERADGHDFLVEARERGAKAFLLERDRAHGVTPPKGGAVGVVPDTRAAMAVVARAFYGDPAERLVLAGVTGTNGKSTTALIIDEIFREAGFASGVIGTLEYRIGERRLKAPHTTPEAIDLHGLFADMLADGVTHATMEVSSHALSLHRVDGCQFDAAVFTNLTPEHLDFHQDIAAYLAAKRALFEDPQFMPAKGRRLNAINIDDEAGGEIAARAIGDTLTYGFSS
ncbi:MAG: UDP-N-acetylmuramoyl-L-alanyl-D-glutamate--2,6-diaminopimelate ligase, partial [Armatimonadetes bacterium]|nr:UDP-N-acetylmuramoyl-L-alanyl-D-glutamate--2,6-diaminopimelate ligase [Armatimonadota bacterium]